MSLTIFRLFEFFNFNLVYITLASDKLIIGIIEVSVYTLDCLCATYRRVVHQLDVLTHKEFSKRNQNARHPTCPLVLETKIDQISGIVAAVSRGSL